MKHLGTVHGPIRITANRQISLPKALLDESRMTPGDQVHIYRDGDGFLRIVDSRLVARWLATGKQADGQTGESDA